ncbi:Csr1p [Sugiyamaella lignohabitans]|uniref:Csr1p n=1 Tax=Sugiyamaella lignohabitans TaxID=796027 RepID=A0A167E6P7_9ASCO|nr:Csr1p [Sugiyamaella lignohabitans]ANB13713.1 Csr1p [Sugiyamaella lignohabitans]
MSTAAKGTLPGRAGNLTTEQEHKLKEFWAQVLIYTGSAPESLATQLTSYSVTSGAAAKKKGGFFSKKDKHVDDIATQSELFRAALPKLTPETFIKAVRFMSRGDNVDDLFLRFLRARKWDVAKALEMFATTISWRVEFGVDELLRTGEEQCVKDKEDGVILQFKTGKAILRGKDKTGRPIVDVHVKLHDPKAQSERDIEKFTIFLIEASRLCLNDPNDTAAVIFDLTDFAISNMDYAAVKFIITCFERHYPECLGFLFIHNAPWVFQGIWNVIKGWIDPVVASKISFTRNHNDLVKLIDDKEIPKSMGGSRPWDFEYLPPVPGENQKLEDHETRDKILAERVNLFKELEQVTVQWISATGEQSNALEAKRSQIIAEVRKNYFLLDPYVRARSAYDRDGTLAEFKQQLHQPELEAAAQAAKTGKAPSLADEKNDQTRVKTAPAAAPAAVTA